MSILIAQIAGPYLLVTGLGFLISTEFYIQMVKKQVNANGVTLNLLGAAHFIIGMIILTHHFQWGSILEIATTFLGISTTIKGMGLILIPGILVEKTNSITKTKLYVIAAVFIALGAYFCVSGYMTHR